MTSEELKNIYLAFWNLAVKEPPRVSDVRELLVRNNLSAERAGDVPPGTAMRRAAEIVKSKSIEAKTFTCQESGRTRTQIDAIAEENGRLRRSFVAQYELGEDDRPHHVSGKELPEFLPAFEEASTHYTGADLSKVIQAILTEDGLGAFSPRKGGGVYFVPVKPEAADLLDRIAKFAESVQVRFLTYTVPDTAAQREEIAEAIANAYAEEIRTHAEAIAAYHAETKPGIVSNRKEAIDTTVAQMGKLSGLMNGRYPRFVQECADLKAKIELLEIEQLAQSELRAQQNHVAGRRRIVTSGV